jgi:predicted nucleic acid-binding Zn ribbon protein
MFPRSNLSFCTFSFRHCVVCSSLIYDSDYRFKFGIFKLYLLWFKFLFISEWLFCLPLKLYWCSIYITDNQIALQIYANKCSRKIKFMSTRLRLLMTLIIIFGILKLIVVELTKTCLMIIIDVTVVWYS